MPSFKTTNPWVLSSSSDSYSSTGEFTMSIPSGTQEGDFLVAMMSQHGDLGVAAVIGNSMVGWTLQLEKTDSFRSTIRVWTKTAVQDEPGAYVDLDGNTRVAWVMLRTDAQTVGEVVDTTNEDSGDSTTPTCPSITTEYNGCMILRIMLVSTADLTLNDYTPPANFIAEALSTNGTNDTYIGVGAETLQLAGSTGTAAGTIQDAGSPSSDGYQAVTIALRGREVTSPSSQTKHLKLPGAYTRRFQGVRKPIGSYSTIEIDWSHPATQGLFFAVPFFGPPYGRVDEFNDGGMPLPFGTDYVTGLVPERPNEILTGGHFQESRTSSNNAAFRGGGLVHYQNKVSGDDNTAELGYRYRDHPLRNMPADHNSVLIMSNYKWNGTNNSSGARLVSLRNSAASSDEYAIIFNTGLTSDYEFRCGQTDFTPTYTALNNNNWRTIIALGIGQGNSGEVWEYDQNYSLFANETGTIADPGSSTSELCIGHRHNNGRSTDFIINYVYMWAGVRHAEAAQSLVRNPWQIFKPRKPVTYSFGSTWTAPQKIALPGAYTRKFQNKQKPIGGIHNWELDRQHPAVEGMMFCVPMIGLRFAPMPGTGLADFPAPFGADFVTGHIPAATNEDSTSNKTLQINTHAVYGDSYDQDGGSNNALDVEVGFRYDNHPLKNEPASTGTFIILSRWRWRNTNNANDAGSYIIAGPRRPTENAEWGMSFKDDITPDWQFESGATLITPTNTALSPSSSWRTTMGAFYGANDAEAWEWDADGQLFNNETIAAGAAPGSQANEDICIGHLDNRGHWIDGMINYVYVWSTLNVEGAKSLIHNPWQIFKPRRPVTYSFPSNKPAPTPHGILPL